MPTVKVANEDNAYTETAVVIGGGSITIERALACSRTVEDRRSPSHGAAIKRVLQTEGAVFLRAVDATGSTVGLFLSHEEAVRLANILLDRAADFHDRLSVIED